MKKIFVALMFSGFLLSCSNDVLESTSDVQNQIPETRASYNGSYFDWDRVNQISYVTNRGSGILSLPWAQGSTQNAGIPNSWIDPNFESKKTSERYYSRENGWNLVYSNLLEKTEQNKFFALYNSKTGVLRFFFNTVVGQSSQGTTNTFVTFNIPTTTSLLNFYSTIASPIDQPKEEPSTMTSIISTFDPSSKTMSGVGFMPDTWYGLEIECAYDPNLSNSSATFSTRIYSSNITITTGKAETTGTIMGTIKGLAQKNQNITLSNMFNGETNSLTSNFTVNNTANIATSLGGKIDANLAKKDNFFTGLWNNIKGGIASGASAGAKSGIKSIFDGGASVATNALKGLLTSFIGGGAENSISKVELDLKAVTSIKATSEQHINNWEIKLAPLPGTKTSSPPLYNKVLGVWNLKENPSVTVNITNYTSIPQTLDGTYTVYDYTVSTPIVIVNPASNMSIKKVTHTLVLKDDSQFSSIKNMNPYAVLDGVNYRGNTYTAGSTVYNMTGSLMSAEAHLKNAKPYVYVNLELTDKTTGKSYFYGKYFNIGKVNIGKISNVVNKRPGSGGLGLGGDGGMQIF